MAPTLSWERWSLAVCLGDKTVFPAALLCRVGPGAGTGSRGGGQQQIPEHRVHNTEQHRDDTPHTHPHVTHTTHCDSGRPAHATHARSWRDRSSRTRSPRGRTRAAARPRCWRFPEASSRDTALVSAHNQRYLLTYLLTYNRQSRFRPRLPPRGDPAGGASAARARGTVQTSWATRRVKHAHHKTSRRRRRSGEDLGHPADERCGGLA